MVRDDMLRMLFTCCHPALSMEARVALTLHILCGLSTVEIARLFLVPDATMGQRITRAKQKIAGARIPYRVPPDHELPDRLAGCGLVAQLVAPRPVEAAGSPQDRAAPAHRIITVPARVDAQLHQAGAVDPRRLRVAVGERDRDVGEDLGLARAGRGRTVALAHQGRGEDRAAEQQGEATHRCSLLDSAGGRP